MKIFPAFNPRWAQGLLRALDMKGDYPSGVSAPYQPSINVCDLDAPEFAFLRGDRLVEGTVAATGDATHVGVVRLFNPNSAEVMLIVDAIDVYTDGTQAIGLLIGGDLTGSSTPQTLVARDSRIQARNTTWATSQSGTALLPAALPAVNLRNRQGFAVSNTVGVHFEGPWILTPFNLTGLPAAQSLNIFGTVVATTITVSFRGRERVWGKAER